METRSTGEPAIRSQPERLGPDATSPKVPDLAALSPQQRQLAYDCAVPEDWLARTTGEVPWAKQVDIMAALTTHRRVAVASANSVGKSFIGARLVLWWMSVYHPSIVITTAPTNNQVEKILWPEIRAGHSVAAQRGRPLGGRMLTTDWKFDETGDAKHFAMGFSPRDYGENIFQGFHSNHILVVVDEAAGISEKVWAGVFSIARGAHTRILAIGNPTVLEGQFYQAFQSKNWWTTHISAFESPNARWAYDQLEDGTYRLKADASDLFRYDSRYPGLICAGDIEASREDWGEGHPLWQARILGRFPDSLTDTLIALTWVEKAANQWPERVLSDTIEIGADVARYGLDSTVFAAQQSGNLYAAEEHNKFDTMEIVGKLVRFGNALRAECRAKQLNPRVQLKIDAVGLGAGVLDRINELNRTWLPQDRFEVHEMIAEARPLDPKNYGNLTTEGWFNLANKLKVSASGKNDQPILIGGEISKPAPDGRVGRA